MKPIRVCTICHNDDDPTDKSHRRVRLELYKEDFGYRWISEGEDAGLPSYDTVREAEKAAHAAWAGDVWAMRSKW